MYAQEASRQNRMERLTSEARFIGQERRWSEIEALEEEAERYRRLEERQNRCDAERKRRLQKEREQSTKEEAETLEGMHKPKTDEVALKKQQYADMKLVVEQQLHKKREAWKIATRRSLEEEISVGGSEASGSNLVIRGTTKLPHCSKLDFHTLGSSTSTGNATAVTAKVRRARAGIVITYEEDEEPGKDTVSPKSGDLLTGKTRPATSRGHQEERRGSTSSYEIRKRGVQNEVNDAKVNSLPFCILC